jgi:hypothetical protein
VIDIHQDARGILSYTVGVRSLDGAGPAARGVALTVGQSCAVTLTNTGAAGYDVYRLSVTQGSGQLVNALAAVKAGESQQIPVYAPAGAVTLKAVSESDSTKIARSTVACK